MFATRFYLGQNTLFTLTKNGLVTYLKIKTDEPINKSEREWSLNHFSTNTFIDFYRTKCRWAGWILNKTFLELIVFSALNVYINVNVIYMIIIKDII